jgi:SAM-dependent methyltransferase
MAEPDPMHAYYSARAPHMAKHLGIGPSGQLAEILTELKAEAQGRTVLEVACGTGYWTQHVAPVSRLTVATDYSKEMLAVASSARIPHVRFVCEDAYELSKVGEERFDFGFAMHWVSHIPMARWDEFFRRFHARLKPGAKVILCDDIRRTNDTDPYYSKLDSRDTFEIRRLPEGGEYEIVKTYFTPESLRSLLSPYAIDLELHFESPRWWVTYGVCS